MCLQAVSGKATYATRKPFLAWKVFYRGGGGKLLTSCRISPVKRGLWLEQESPTYGWHAFVNRNDARAYADKEMGETTIRVKLAGDVTFGSQEIYVGTTHMYVPAVMGERIMVPALKKRKKAGK